MSSCGNMPRESKTNQLLHRPSRRKVLKTSAGTLTALGAGPVTAAADHTEDRPAAVNDLFRTLNCFEQVARSADLALVVDFRREGIERLREATDDDETLSLLEEAERHNEDAAEAVVDGRSDDLQESLDQTQEALEQLETNNAADLIEAQDTPFQTIFGEDVESPSPESIDINTILERGEDFIGVDPTLIKLVLRTFNSEDKTLELSLTNISRITDPETSRAVVFRTETYLDRMTAVIEQLTTTGYSVSFDDLSTVMVSDDTITYSTSLGLSSWLWATGYGISQVSINLMVLGIATDTMLSIVTPLTTATRSVLRTVRDAVVDALGDVVPEVVAAYIEDRLAEQAEDDIDTTGRLDALIPFGLIVTHVLKAEVETVEEFGEQLSVANMSSVEDLESLLGEFATVRSVVWPLEAYSDVAGINFLTEPIEEFDEEINELIDQTIGVDLLEAVDTVRDFARSLFLRVLNLEMVRDRLPESAVNYLSDQLEESEESLDDQQS